MRAAILSAGLLLAAAPAMAQAIDGATARGQLFATRGVELALSGALSELDRAIVSEMVKEADRRGQGFRFYGSIAYSPSEGLQAESLQGAFNFHSTAASDSAAVARCNQARKPGSSACQVAAQILPRRYEPGRVQLSYDATNGFRSTYRRVRGAKAMAISDSTGAWKMAEGVDAADATATAVALCNEAARELRGSDDCRVVIAD